MNKHTPGPWLPKKHTFESAQDVMHWIEVVRQAIGLKEVK